MKTSFTLALLASSAFIGFSAFAEDVKPAAASEVKTEVKAETKAESKPAAPAKDYVILSTAGEEIKFSEVMEIWKGLFKGNTAPDFATFDENVRQNVLRGIVSERLIYKEALKNGFDKKDEVKKRLESLQKQVIMQSYMEEKAKNLVTDEQLKAEYNTRITALKDVEEVKARHILVAGEDEAKKLVSQLKKGGDFEKIAKEKSTDKASGTRGGDLGWFTKDKMVAEFADAAFKLKKGELSAPVKSAFGWHIIKLEDRRPVKAPTFEESKEDLKGAATSKALQAYIESLLKTANIKYLDEAGKEKPFQTSLIAPKAEAKPAEKATEKTAEKTVEKTTDKPAEKK